MLRSRWILAVLVVLALGGAWLVFEGSGRSERAIVEGIVEEEEPPEPVPTPPIQLEPVEGEEAEPGRISVEDDELDGSTPSAADQDAHFSVQVAALETSAPLPDILVVLQRSKASMRLFATASRGPAGETLKTDARGQVEYAVPPGHDYVLTVAVGGERRAAELVQDVPAFAPGERRDLVVRLVTASDLVWFGRVLDGETNLPIAGARVWRLTGRPFADAHGPAATTDASGLVQLDSASWVASFARVEQPGYAIGLAVIERGHDQASSACAVHLFRAAELEVFVNDPDGAARPDLRVRLSCPLEERVQGNVWNLASFQVPPIWGLTDASGRCVLADLPARARLTLEFLGGVKILRREAQPLLLEPGEHRMLVCTVGSVCTVRGLILEADGRPAAGEMVWLLPDDGIRYMEVSRVKDAVDSTVSDNQGRFTFEGVAAGAWQVAPAPKRERGTHAAAPVATAFVIQPDQISVEVTLTCWRELFIGGSVVGPDGEPVDGAFVLAQGEGLVATASAKGGQFLLGPLPPGSFAMRASDVFGSCAEAQPLTVPAGTMQLTLRLRRGGDVTVTVLDSRANPVSGVMVLVLDEATTEGSREGVVTDVDGRATLGGRLPGSYTISASSDEGEFARASGVRISPGASTAEIELKLEPAARLRILVPSGSTPQLLAKIMQDGRRIGYGLIDSDPVVVVPEGELEIVLSRFGYHQEELQRRTVRAIRGEVTDVRFDLAPPR